MVSFFEFSEWIPERKVGTKRKILACMGAPTMILHLVNKKNKKITKEMLQCIQKDYGYYRYVF